MPYFIYIITVNEATQTKSVKHVAEFESFKSARTEVKHLRADAPLPGNQSYKIIFADDSAAAEKNLREVRDQPVPREWEI